jgi:hypothetical protein
MMTSKETETKDSGSGLWKRLYGMIWLNVLTFILVPSLLIPGVELSSTEGSILEGLHILVGGAVLALAIYNMTSLEMTVCPDRIKRISKVIVEMSVISAILGAIIAVGLWNLQTFCSFDIIRLMHLVVSLAIITQATSVATGYDMWEEKEFEPKKAEANPKPS